MADRNAGQTPEQINAGLLQENALLQAEVQRLRRVVAWCQSLLPSESDRPSSIACSTVSMSRRGCRRCGTDLGTASEDARISGDQRSDPSYDLTYSPAA